MTTRTALALALTLTACAARPTGSEAAPERAAVDPERLSSIVRVLASDAFEGRAPGTPGEDKTVAYLIGQLQALGLEPGGPDGAWTQSVPMVQTAVQTPAPMAFTGADAPQPLEQGASIAVTTVRALDRLAVEDVGIVFAGFGVHAPEQDWDDFGDVDLTDKLVVVLVNDPDFAAGPDEPAAGRFGGRRMTYYGRWAYKYEEAARRGAWGALVIHEDAAAGYGWSVAAGREGRQVSLGEQESGAPKLALQGWLHDDAATRLFSAAGHDLDALRVAARSPDFEAFELEGLAFTADLDVTTERFESRNVLGLLPGSRRPDELLVASAHWDAYGIGAPDDEGRTIRPGANDDALGCAGVLELARVLRAGPPLERSVLFAFWTAEESGLIGSQAYVESPPHLLATTVANLTLDILQTAGAARDVILVGKGQSELEDHLARAAAAQGRRVTEESRPEAGLFYRADHFSFARVGVPVLLIMGIAGGNDLVEGGRAAGERWVEQYVAERYHTPQDAWSAEWDLAGAVQDVELVRGVIEGLANSREWPRWKDGSEFQGVREATAQARR